MEFTLLGFLALLVLSLVVGLIAQSIVGYPGGLLAATGTGFVGALIGIWLANATGLPELLAVNVGGMRFPIAWALLGAILLLAIVSLISGRGRFVRRRYT